MNYRDALAFVMQKIRPDTDVVGKKKEKKRKEQEKKKEGERGEGGRVTYITPPYLKFCSCLQLYHLSEKPEKTLQRRFLF